MVRPKKLLIAIIASVFVATLGLSSASAFDARLEIEIEGIICDLDAFEAAGDEIPDYCSNKPEPVDPEDPDPIDPETPGTPSPSLPGTPNPVFESLVVVIPGRLELDEQLAVTPALFVPYTPPVINDTREDAKVVIEEKSEPVVEAAKAAVASASLLAIGGAFRFLLVKPV